MKLYEYWEINIGKKWLVRLNTRKAELIPFGSELYINMIQETWSKKKQKSESEVV